MSTQLDYEPAEHFEPRPNTLTNLAFGGACGFIVGFTPSELSLAVGQMVWPLARELARNITFYVVALTCAVIGAAIATRPRYHR
jgi:hypothetical protein